MPPGFIDPRQFLGPAVPRWLLARKEISAGAKLLYSYLANSTHLDEQTQGCAATEFEQDQLAGAIGASERSIRNWLRELENQRLIRQVVLGWGRANHYWFLKHPWQGRLNGNDRR